MKLIVMLLPLILICEPAAVQNGQVYKLIKGKIHFKSDAPLELIEASSNKLKGIIDIEKRSFAFSIPLTSFEGFNNPLQKEHFNENYMESSKYPNATFSGKIIENFDLTQSGTYSIRAKGKLNIHGVSQERIIKSDVVVEGDSLMLSADFSVLLEEHNINIPKIVYQKIANEIQVHVEATLEISGNE